ncbi:glycoside hydrolase family protein [Flavobacterium nackdongense]|uniref:Glucuronyl hydrolase n=1 Tax=Flavobacterium nackdongense TaxID=2547394 RepID=A0A4P6YA61_9FLAO|nr:glycoside hydrolase family 88 protein [Flavobacterium nackdongense]QBN17457.1 glucuronyl hydrolase [Flavobacterium nackdongense]
MKKPIFNLLALFLSLFLSLSLFSQTKVSDAQLKSLAENAVSKSLEALANSTLEIKDSLKYPNQGTKDFKWQLQTSGDWTSGFYPGCLWYAYELSNDEKYKNWAKKWTSGIEQQKFNNKTHDLGFRFNCAFGNGFRLAPNDPDSQRYKEILLTAAATADSRYSTVIQQYPSDWDEKAKTIENSVGGLVDVMMNLELLLWASENGGDPAIKDRCIAHAKNVFRDFVRADGGTYHIVRYNKDNGIILNKGQLQGDVDESTWSRGHAWMVYGYTVMYRKTKNPEFLKNAMLLADYFIAHLPEDKIANWDFQSKLEHRDASASAIVCSALFELQGYITSSKLQKQYLNQAKSILASLCQLPYFTEGKGTNSLLYHSTQYFHKTQNTDVPCIFADYYFLESLIRYRNL